jgi:hypothetical protein
MLRGYCVKQYENFRLNQRLVCKGNDSHNQDRYTFYYFRGSICECFLLLFFVLFFKFWFLIVQMKIPDPPDQTDQKNPPQTVLIPTGFSPFPSYHGLEIPQPEGHGSGGQMSRNLPELTRAQPYMYDCPGELEVSHPSLSANIHI